MCKLRLMLRSLKFEKFEGLSPRSSEVPGQMLDVPSGKRERGVYGIALSPVACLYFLYGALCLGL